MDRLCLVVPIWKRPALTRHVLKWYRALAVPGVSVTIIVAGSEGAVSRRLAEGLEYVEAPNDLIDQKYDIGIAYSQRFQPDAVCLVGSDDFIDARYFEWALRQVRRGVDLVGLLDFYLVDGAGRRVLYWGGYDNHRRGEPIGAGRVYSRRILDQVHWKPYWSPQGYKHCCEDDERAYAHVVAAGGQVRTANMAHIGCQYWAIKTGEEINPISAFEAIYPVVDITVHSWALFERTVRHDLCHSDT